jgi:hypothetical protein
MATKAADGKWTVTSMGHPINTGAGMEGCAHLTEDGKMIVFSRSWTDKGPRRGLLYATRTVDGNWNAPSLLAYPVNLLDRKLPKPENAPDNPFLMGTRLIFEKPVAGQKVDLFSFPLDSWSNPKLTPLSVLNSTDDDTQFWSSPDGKVWLFCRSHIVIYRYEKNVLTPIIASGLVANMPYAGPIGEPSMDKDGNLYFLYTFKVWNPLKNWFEYDADIVKMKVRA